MDAKKYKIKIILIRMINGMLSQSFMKIKFADCEKTVLTNKNPTDIIKVQSNLTLKIFLRRKIRKYLHKRYNRAEMFR